MAGFNIASKIQAAIVAASYEQSAVYLIKLDASDTPVHYASLQYFPESLTDSKSVDWQTKPIPGGSLPLYQWTGSGERTISFTAQFSTDLDLYSQRSTGGVGQYLQRLEGAGQLKYNVDIRSAVAWLRSNMLPTYTGGASVTTPAKTAPPNKLLLYIPYSGIGLAGGGTSYTGPSKDIVVCVQTSCEVTWEKFFPSGYPKMASVSLAFAQIPQYKGVVNFPAVTDQMKQAYGGAGTSTTLNAAVAGSTSPQTLAGARTNFLGYRVKSATLSTEKAPPKLNSISNLLGGP